MQIGDLRLLPAYSKYVRHSAIQTQYTSLYVAYSFCHELASVLSSVLLICTRRLGPETNRTAQGTSSLFSQSTAYVISGGLFLRLLTAKAFFIDNDLEKYSVKQIENSSRVAH